MNKPVVVQTFDIDKLERDISLTLEEENQRLNDSTPTPVPSMPDYVEHRVGIDAIGALSAEGVIHKFEHTAQEVEAMGTELRAVAKRCEDMLRDVAEALDVVKETAAQIRETGKLIFLKIEDASLMAGEVKNTCVELKTKMTPTVV